MDHGDRSSMTQQPTKIQTCSSLTIYSRAFSPLSLIFGIKFQSTPPVQHPCLVFTMSSFGAAPSPGRPNSIAPNDCNVSQPGNDGISSLNWSPTANFLVSSNWDDGVRCWEVQEQGGQVGANPKAQVNHESSAPVLDTCFSADGSTVFSGGVDKAVRMWRLGETPPNNIAQQIGAHDAPVKAVGFLPSNLVVSGGWDRKLKFWDTRSPNPAGTLDLPERVYDLDVRGNLMVVVTAGRHILTYGATCRALS